MKSIVSMLVVLVAVLLVSSPAQARYADGMNSYAAYYVMRGGLDPMGTDSIKILDNTQLNEDGSFKRTQLGPTHIWTVTTPETGKCKEDETQLIEYELMWTSGHTVNKTTVSGGYHVTVQQNEAKDTWHINLGSGTGHYQSAKELALKVWESEGKPNITPEEFQDRIKAQEPEEQRRIEARQLTNSKGNASYRITTWCICTADLGSAKLSDPENIPRANVETATASTMPARLFTQNQNADPRRSHPWRMSKPVGDNLRSIQSTAGQINWEFGDPAKPGGASVVK